MTSRAMTNWSTRLLAGALLVWAVAPAVDAQRGRGAGPAPAQSPQSSAPIDLTGYWVSIVNEDWRWRMVTPGKGDVASVPLTPEGLKIAKGWDPATDGSCLAYGAAGLMRMPTRLHITWESDDRLKIETDAGLQTRLLLFDRTTAPPSAPSLQGLSIAEWERPGAGRIGAGRAGGAAAPVGGHLKVFTTQLSAAWLRRNGVPYSAQTTMTEYFDRFATTGGDQWLIVTTVVTDPNYLTQDFVTSTHFRREPDGSKWDPSPCKP